MVIDASFWVAIFVEDDAHYTEASDFLERALELKQAFHVPALALAEVGGAIARKTGDRVAAEIAVQYLVSQHWIAIHQGSEELSRGAARVAIECMLRGADAVYVVLARQESAPLITLDNEMLKRSASAILAMTPGDWLRQNPADRP